MLNTAYSEIYQTASEITAEVTRATGAEAELSSRISVNADNITAEVTRAGNAESQLQLTLDGITISGNVITIKGNQINMGDYVTVTNLQANYATITDLDTEKARINAIMGGTAQLSGVICAGNISAVGAVSAGGVYVGNTDLSTAIATIGTASESGGSISIPTTRLNGSAGTPINFNIAATQFYQDGIAAVHAEYTPVTLTLQGSQATIETVDTSTRAYFTRFGYVTLYERNADGTYTSAGLKQWHYTTGYHDDGEYYMKTTVQSLYYNAGQTVSNTYYTHTPPPTP